MFWDGAEKILSYLHKVTSIRSNKLWFFLGNALLL